MRPDLNRIALLALVAVLGLLSAALCAGVAVAALDVPPPPQQRPSLVSLSPSGRQSTWYFETMPGIAPEGGLPCDNPAPLEAFVVEVGALTWACVNADDRARWTYTVEGLARRVRWGPAAWPLEDVGGVVHLPLIARAEQ
jgi:hypothetical protein